MKKEATRSTVENRVIREVESVPFDDGWPLHESLFLKREKFRNGYIFQKWAVYGVKISRFAREDRDERCHHKLGAKTI